MGEIKQWIREHKEWILDGGIAVVAFVVGLGLVFAIHPVGTLSKEHMLSFPQIQKESEPFVGLPTKEPAIEDLLSVDLADIHGKVQKNWLSLPAFVKKFGKSESYTQEKTNFETKVQLGYGKAVKGIYPYKLEFQEKDKDFYLSAIQGFAPRSSHYKPRKNLKKEDFTHYKIMDGQKEKGSSIEEVCKKAGLPNSFSLMRTKDKQIAAISYQAMDGLVSLTFERDASGQYRLSKKG